MTDSLRLTNPYISLFCGNLSSKTCQNTVKQIENDKIYFYDTFLATLVKEVNKSKSIKYCSFLDSTVL